MATRKVPHTRAQAVDPPPKVWPFPTWKGQPYKQPKQRKRKTDPTEGIPEALL
jgi:hypothetical protein